MSGYFALIVVKSIGEVPVLPAMLVIPAALVLRTRGRSCRGDVSERLGDGLRDVRVRAPGSADVGFQTVPSLFLISLTSISGYSTVFRERAVRGGHPGGADRRGAEGQSAFSRTGPGVLRSDAQGC